MNREEFTSALIEQFSKGVAHLSYSALLRFKQSPKSFIDYKVNPKEQTDSMKLGTLVHCLVLQPEDFKKKYVTDTDICNEIGGAKPRATKAYKEWAGAQTSEIIKQDVLDLATMMADSVKNNPAASWVLSKAESFEVKMEFEHEGLKFKSFLDGYGQVILDLKICRDAAPDKFRRVIINDGYYLQAGVYEASLQGEILPYYIIAVDQSGGVSVHELEDDLIDFGMQEFSRLSREFKDCLNTNSFHSSYEYRAPMPNGIYNMSRPPYLS